ncbi:MAG: hydroxyacid dehydrogenase [Candidatus Marinimicrobia bacterium]|nr:hydroxyacid dehydrogenase [Candidatus Neomarinimicrobiota bacterium]
MSKNVFFYEAFEEEQNKLKQYLPATIKAGFTWKTIQEYGQKKPEAKIISTRTQSNLPLEWAYELEGILSRSTGYDHLVKYYNEIEDNIELGYLPLYCNRAVAEQAIMLMLALFRRLPLQMHNFENFNRDGLTGFEAEGKTLVVYGVGNIGSEVYKIGKGLGMQVYGVDIEQKYQDFNYIEPNQGFEKADVIVCSMNLTTDNINYFGYKELSKCKKRPLFVNVARGELSYSADLLQAVQENCISGVALDVYNQEGKLADNLRDGENINSQEIKAVQQLKQKPNVILTPHNSFNTEEAVQRKSEQSIQQIKHFLENGKFYWEVPL